LTAELKPMPFPKARSTAFFRSCSAVPSLLTEHHRPGLCNGGMAILGITEVPMLGAGLPALRIHFDVAEESEKRVRA
jgi:hypothetical protein